MPIIRVSEISEYVYCARSWWFRRVAGEEPGGHARRERGTWQHTQHGWLVRLSTITRLLAGLLLLAALLTFIVAATNHGLPM
ncbi:MAG: hypothetical protein HC884_09350 [Chloroflexaceae bacterium]|nr:hypothetical protein [Chloroflexaceae bacterium]